MTISTAAHAVTDVASSLTVTEHDYTPGYDVVLANTGANPVFIGALGVTAATGFPVAAGATSPVLKMSKGTAVFMICGTGLTSTVIAMEVGV